MRLPHLTGAIPALPQALDVGRDLLQSFAPIQAIHEHVCAWHFYAREPGAMWLLCALPCITVQMLCNRVQADCLQSVS